MGLAPERTIDPSSLTKREFLAALGAVAVSALAGRPAVAQSKRPRNFVWLRPSLTKSPADWRRDFSLMRASGIHGIVPEIYNGRQALFQSRRLPVRAPWLEGVLPLAADAGLEVHAWMWCMPCSIERRHQGTSRLVQRERQGEAAWDKPAYVDYYKFLDPARPEVREFVRDTVRELAAMPGLTGVHLDYIRHPDAILPSGLWSKYGIVQDKVYRPYDYGYTEYSRRAFKAKTRDRSDPIAGSRGQSGVAAVPARFGGRSGERLPRAGGARGRQGDLRRGVSRSEPREDDGSTGLGTIQARCVFPDALPHVLRSRP